MSDLRDLYQELVLDHGKRPRNFRTPPDANREASGFNPLCGDRITVFLRVENGVVVDAAFQGSGCAISTASASLMTESLKGKTIEEVEAMFARFHDMLTGGSAAPGSGLGKLTVFAGVRDFPVRVKCATLPWHTLRSALRGEGTVASTE